MAIVKPSFHRAQIGDIIQYQCDGVDSWASSDPTVLTIDPQSGQAECKGLGATKITAYKGGQALGSTWLCASGGVSPDTVQLQIGQSQLITSTGSNPIASMQSGSSSVATTSGATITCAGTGYTVVYAFDEGGNTLGTVQVFGGALVINPATGGDDYYQLSGAQWMANPVNMLPSAIQHSFLRLEPSDFGGTWTDYTSSSALAYSVDLQNVPLDGSLVLPVTGTDSTDSNPPADQTIYVYASDGGYYQIDADTWKSDPAPASEFPDTVQTAMTSMINGGDAVGWDPPPSEDTERSAGSDASAIYLNCYLINLQSLQPPS